MVYVTTLPCSNLINYADVFTFTTVNTVHCFPCMLKVKGLDIYIRPLTGKPEQQRFTMRSGILTCSDTGGAVQVVAAHCPNEWTLDPAVCSYNRTTYAPASRTTAFTPQCSLAMIHYF